MLIACALKEKGGFEAAFPEVFINTRFTSVPSAA